MGNRADEVDDSLGFPDVIGGDKEQQQAIRTAARNPGNWFSKVVQNLLDEMHPTRSRVPKLKTTLLKMMMMNIREMPYHL